MGRAARELVEDAGIDVDVLLDKLVAAAGAELATFYYYAILRANAVDLDDGGMKEIVENARIEDRNHFEALVPWIYELGGQLPDDIRELADRSSCPDAYLPESAGGDIRARRTGETPTTALGAYPAAVGNSVQDLLTVLVEAERCAIRTYTDICTFTAGKDYRTYELSLAILNEEIEHEAWFSEFRGDGPSGHYRRGAPGHSPYVSRFMSADVVA